MRRKEASRKTPFQGSEIDPGLRAGTGGAQQRTKLRQLRDPVDLGVPRQQVAVGVHESGGCGSVERAIFS